jgi:hypothetical protein
VRCPCRFVSSSVLWVVLLFLTGFSAAAQEAQPSTLTISSQPDQPLDVSSYCETLSKRTAQSAALAHVCQFALSLGQRLPNVTCSQETIRYEDSGHGFRLQDVVTAQVSYERGQERYKEMATNGKPIESATPDLTAGWSTGEFASALVGIFSPLSLAEFKFKKNDMLHGTPALVFEFRIAKLDNELWYVQAGDAKTYPGYSGQLWINATTFHPIRLERGHIEVNADFPIRQMESVIDYADVQLGDGTSFDLPAQAETVACHAAKLKPCWKSVLKFRNWHKFATSTRILSDPEPPLEQAPKSGSTPDPAPVPLQPDSSKSVQP